MPDPSEIVLRQTPGRDATSSELARSRGELRRRPHVSEPAAPSHRAAASTPAPAAAAPARREVTTGEYGRKRLYH